MLSSNRNFSPILQCDDHTDDDNDEDGEDDALICTMKPHFTILSSGIWRVTRVTEI